MFSIPSYWDDITYNGVETPTILDNTENYIITGDNNTKMITVFTKFEARLVSILSYV